MNANCDTPSKLPVVLIHGWGGSFDSTYAVTGWIEGLEAQGRPVFQVDLPGHGLQGGSHNCGDYSDLATLLAEKLPIEALDAVGFSLGGKLLLELAVRMPKRFRRIVIGGVGDNVFGPELLGKEVADALENGVTKDTPKSISALVAYSEKSGGDPLSLAAVLRRPANPKLTIERLKNVTCPVLLINGEEDSLARPDELLVYSLPDVQLRLIPGVDHLGLTSHPEFVNAAISFLDEAV